MRVFQAPYKDRHGRKCKAKKWTVEFTDHLAAVRRVTGFTDMRQSEALGRRIDDLVAMKGNGAVLPPDMTKWIEDMPPKLRAHLAEIGLLDAGRVAAMRPLADHLDGPADAPGWRQHLAAKANTAEYVEKACARVRKIFEGCGFAFWSDIDASKVEAYLDGLRDDTRDKQGRAKRGMSAQTFNYYLGAFKGFCRWMVKDRRATESPIAHLDGLNVKTDRRRVRRALSAEEIRWLLDVTRNHGAECHGMSGPARAMLYRVAVETGLRRGELASLTRASFYLDRERPTVTVEAAYSKHRKADTLPLRADTAADLRGYLAAKLPGAAAFAIPHCRHTSAALFRADLDAARAAWRTEAKTPEEKQRRKESSFLSAYDDAGRVVDFHALRHTCGSLLAASGAHPKVAQSIMRHSTIELTMSRYTHVFAGQEADALAALPDLARPVAESAKRTGTDDLPATADAVSGHRNRAAGHGQTANNPKSTAKCAADDISATADAPRCPTNDSDANGRAVSRPKRATWPGATASGDGGATARTVTGDFSCPVDSAAEGDGGKETPANMLARPFHDLSLCLALPGGNLPILRNTCEYIGGGVAQRENPCKTGVNPIESAVTNVSGRVMELADIRDLKFRGPQGPWGFDSPLAHSLLPVQ